MLFVRKSSIKYHVQLEIRLLEIVLRTCMFVSTLLSCYKDNCKWLLLRKNPYYCKNRLKIHRPPNIIWKKLNNLKTIANHLFKKKFMMMIIFINSSIGCHIFEYVFSYWEHPVFKIHLNVRCFQGYVKKNL